MIIDDTIFPEVKVIKSKKHIDDRGFFSEVFSEKDFARVSKKKFVQDNHSLSIKKNTLRGLHFQVPPFTQDKLVRVSKGSILDIIVDVRKNSSSFGKSAVFELDSQNWHQLWVPVGFAHGFLTLEDNTEVLYKVTNYYDSNSDKGINAMDPLINIPQKYVKEKYTLSDKDKLLPNLSNAKILL